MAKRGSKAAAIRDYIQQFPTAKASEVVEALAKRRITVLPTQVYSLMSKAPATPAPTVQAPAASNGHEKIADQPLIHAKDFARVCGGIDGARKVLDTLASLQV